MARLMQMLLSATGPKTFQAFEQACGDPQRSQAELLRRIVHANAASDFGRTHGFSRADSPSTYAARVPFGTYASHEPYIERALAGKPNQLTREDPVFFATTSGTTGASKYIPVTASSRSAKSRLSRLTLYSIHRNCPKALSGRILSVVSPEVESQAPSGVPCGSESGHAYRNLPSALRLAYACPYDVFEIGDYEAKYYTLLRLAAAADDVTMLFSVNPSTVLLLGKRLGSYAEDIVRDIRDGTLRSDLRLQPGRRAELTRGLRPDPKRARALERRLRDRDGQLLPRDIWPRLATVVCWKGGTVGQYIERFGDYFPRNMKVHEIGYLSSEHRGSLPLSCDGDLGALAVDTNYYEFWPVEAAPPTSQASLLGVHELEEGRRYFLYVTTLGGLYRYDMNDIIEVGGFFGRTPLIRFIQKGKGVVSFTGEKLYENQVLSATERALSGGPPGHEFITAVGSLQGETVQYRFLVEYREPPGQEEARALAGRIDHELSRANMEYAGKRSSQRIAPPILRIIPDGSFDAYREAQVLAGRKDGQFKVLRLTTDTTFERDFPGSFEIAATEPS